MKQLVTLLFPFCLLFIACDDDDMISEPPAYAARQASAFDCTNVDGQIITAADFQINEVIKFGDYFCFGGFDNFLVMDENLDEAVLERAVNVREFLLFENKLIICAEGGLYQFTADEVFSMLTEEVNCKDVIIGPNGELLIADSGTQTQSIAEFIDGTVTRYSDMSLEPEMCIGICDLALSGERTVWASTCSDLILKFNGTTLEEVSNTEDEPLLESNAGDLFLLPYEEGVVVVAKNGTGFYQILKYAGGEWIELIHFSLLNSVTTSKEVFMTRPSLVEAFIKDDFLYVATTLAGCEGIQRFDVSKNEELTEDDYDAFEDPFYRSQCIHGFTLDENGDVYVNVSGNQLVRVDCP